MTRPPARLTSAQARGIWLRAQRLDVAEPFGSGPEATPAAVAHLGYVQIDTIHVIERCHHHILYTRIPSYRRAHLQQAQSLDKSVVEYWTHALSYLPVESLRFYVRHMRRDWERRGWVGDVTARDIRRVVSLIRKAARSPFVRSTTTRWRTGGISGPAASRPSGRSRPPSTRGS